MATRMLQRRGTSAEWAAENPILSDGEFGLETDTFLIKFGDGVTAWNDLAFPYSTIAYVDAADANIVTYLDSQILTRVAKDGDTMTGPLTLIEPTEPAHAARLADIPEDPGVTVHGIDKHALKAESIRSGKDSEGIFTVIEYNRPDGSRRMRSELSGGTSPEYTTRTVTWYAADGTTTEDSVAYTLTYDVDGDLVQEVVAV